MDREGEEIFFCACQTMKRKVEYIDMQLAVLPGVAYVPLSGLSSLVCFQHSGDAK